MIKARSRLHNTAFGVLVCLASLLAGCRAQEARVSVVYTGMKIARVELYPAYWPAPFSTGPSTDRLVKDLGHREQLDFVPQNETYSRPLGGEEANRWVDRRRTTIVAYCIGKSAPRAFYIRDEKELVVAFDETEGVRVFTRDQERVSPHRVSEGPVPGCFGGEVY